MNQKKALLFGSTGLVGAQLLEELLHSDIYAEIIVFVRNELTITHEKIQQFLTDFENLNLLKSEMKGDDVFICLGTTMAKAGSKDAFFKVDFTYVFDIANMCAANKVNQIILVSSMGADEYSSVFYSRVKGKLEKNISEMDFSGIHILRPSLLMGNRKEHRAGEKFFIWFTSCFKFIFTGFLGKYAPIKASDVAKAMLLIANSGRLGKHTYESSEIQIWADKNKLT